MTFETFDQSDEETRPDQIKPSKMEVAPLHRTVDITQKRVLFKNTKKTKKRSPLWSRQTKERANYAD